MLETYVSRDVCLDSRASRAGCRSSFPPLKMGLVQTTARWSGHKHFMSTQVQEPSVSSCAPEGSAHSSFSDGGADGKFLGGFPIPTCYKF